MSSQICGYRQQPADLNKTIKQFVIQFLYYQNKEFTLGSVSPSAFFFSYFLATGSSCQNRYDSQAFLFSLINKPGWAPVKLNQTGQYSHYRLSIYDCSSSGPTFGNGWDLAIYDYASSNTNSYTNLGYTYSPPSGYNYGDSFTRTFLAGTYQFTPDEVEIFYETT